MSQPSSACCTTPPVVAKDYKPKGSYSNVADFKSYITGPADAKKAILVTYDIFGFSPQLIQGADILAYSNKASPYQVIIPDFFHGEGAQPAWYAPGSEDGPAKIKELFATKASFSGNAAHIPKIISAFTASNNIEEWGALGMCWGGKVIVLASGEGTAFKAAAQAHPAMLDPSEASKISIPFATLASGAEKKEDVEAFGENLKGEKIVEIFGDQVHGWLATRADLEDQRKKEEYVRGYGILADFFGKYL